MHVCMAIQCTSPRYMKINYFLCKVYCKLSYRDENYGAGVSVKAIQNYDNLAINYRELSFFLTCVKVQKVHTLMQSSRCNIPTQLPQSSTMGTAELLKKHIATCFNFNVACSGLASSNGIIMLSIASLIDTLN